MPFKIGDPVFAVSVADTGSVTDIPKPQENLIDYDQLAGTGRHHDDDLRAIPFNGRVYKTGFYYIINADLVDGQRVHRTVCCRNDGRKLWGKKQRGNV